MITGGTLDSNFMVLALKTHFEARLREKLQEASQRVINEVVSELSDTLQLSVNKYVDAQFYEQVVKVIVEDRRK